MPCPLGSHMRRHESPRHGAQHEPAPNDPARRHLRACTAGGRARRRGRARHRRLRHLRQPHPPVRVRAERLDQRPELPRARQRARPDHRQHRTAHWNSRFPKRPIRKNIKGLPAFTTVRGGAYFFLPGINALRYLASLRGADQAKDNRPWARLAAARTYNQSHVPRHYTPGGRRISIYWTWSYPWEAQRDPTEMDNRFSTMTEVRNALWPGYETPEYDAANFLQGIAGTLEFFHRSTLAFQELAGEAHRPSRRRLPAHRPGGLPAADRRADPRRHRHPDGVRPRPPPVGTRGGSRRKSAPFGDWLQREGTCLLLGPPPRRRLHRRLRTASNGIPPSRRPARPAPAAVRSIHPLPDERPSTCPCTTVGAASGRRRGHRGDRAADRDSAIWTRLRLLDNVTDLQLPPASAALRTHRAESDIRACARRAARSTRTGPHPFTAAGNTEFNCADLDAARPAVAPATSCSSTPRTSPRCSAAPKASRTSGITSQR